MTATLAKQRTALYLDGAATSWRIVGEGATQTRACRLKSAQLSVLLRA